MFKLKNYKYLLLLMLFAFAGQNAWGSKAWFRMQVEAKCKDTDGNIRDDIGFVAVKFSTQPTEATKRADIDQAHNGIEYW